ncbi:MAG: hypothetical protein EPN92_13660 [Chitinophagaceae bacterium]|nr:MAG: hypothetical protein EPN92_13660 [Chitinophagaceae bacterium]
MERIQNLINKLQEQINRQADPAQMQMTLQLLQVELNQLSSSRSKVLGTSKVSVVMPGNNVPVYSSEKTSEDDLREEQPVYQTYHKVKQKTTGQLGLTFDPLTDTPTLSHQKGVMEVNEAAYDQQESLNDRLRENKTEVMHVLKESPIRDLRKAIGINERFIFVTELFRGDESMYERCIKTINSFNIYAEAEYWMNRELMVKLGWDDSREIVKHFYQLVRRRFS